MEIVLVGLNHQSAPVEIREKLAFSADDVRETLPLVRERLGASEAMILSTCNRVEILIVRQKNPADSPHPLPLTKQSIVQTLCELRGGEAAPPTDDILYEHRQEEAVRHMARLATGLDSMVLGETEILGQLKQAYSLATETTSAGRYVNRINHLAFRAGKRARTETELGLGGVSVASVAASLAAKVFGNLDQHTALIIGAGEMAELASRHLHDNGVGNMLFVNRSLEKAEQLAAEFDGDAMPFDKLNEALEIAEIVISSTAAPGLIFTHDKFHKVMDKRHGRPIFLVDIAVPRDIDPEINDHDNAFVYDMDSLSQVADQNLGRRRKAIPKAEEIVDQEVNNYLKWLENLRVEPLIRQLHDHFDSARRCLVIKNQGRFCKKEQSDLEKLTHQIQNKILHRPMEILRKYDPETEEGRKAIEIVRDLFDLK